MMTSHQLIHGHVALREYAYRYRNVPSRSLAVFTWTVCGTVQKHGL